MDDCHRSYRRKDHLTRHLLQHEGKIFVCPVGGCGRRFTLQGNMRRHVKEFHNEEGCSCRGQSQQQHICPEEGCGKVFRYLSKLKKHMDSHGMVECQVSRHYLGAIPGFRGLVDSALTLPSLYSPQSNWIMSMSSAVSPAA